MFLIALALMLFAVATLLDATAGRVLVLLVAIVLTATLLTAMLASLAAVLLVLSTMTALLLAALVLALATLLLATLLLVHEFLLREKGLACGNVSGTRQFRNSIDLPEICACTKSCPDALISVPLGLASIAGQRPRSARSDQTSRLACLRNDIFPTQFGGTRLAKFRDDLYAFPEYHCVGADP
jgi:hypothetical protein